jgi:hypothetical protein
MTAWNAALAAQVAPCLFLTGRRLWHAEAGWIASLLYLLDLAVWHHLGRSHAPAVFGAALGTIGLSMLAAAADSLLTRRQVALAGCALGLAALGYSSLVVLYGLFGGCLVALLLVDAGGLSVEARKGLAATLVLGGPVAGALFYSTACPGSWAARAASGGAGSLPGKTFIFHNDRGRASAFGSWDSVPLLAGLLAAPLALLRAKPWARPVLVAWLMAWALIMVLKEPSLFPSSCVGRGNQFVPPLLCCSQRPPVRCRNRGSGVWQPRCCWPGRWRSRCATSGITRTACGSSGKPGDSGKLLQFRAFLEVPTLCRSLSPVSPVSSDPTSPSA